MALRFSKQERILMEKLGIAADLIRKWERGVCLPSMEKARKAARATGRDIRDLRCGLNRRKEQAA